MKFDLISKPDEILRCLRSSDGNVGNLVWQNLKSHRALYSIVNITFENEGENARLSTLGGGVSLDVKRPVFVKISFRGSVFKAEIAYLDGDDIVIKIPEEIQVGEFRKHKRKNFQYQDERLVTLAFKSDFFQTARFHLNVRLMNLSPAGLGLLTSHQNKEVFGGNQEIFLQSLCSERLVEPIKLDIVHSSSVRFRSQGRDISGVRFGAKLETLLEKDFLAEFLARHPAQA